MTKHSSLDDRFQLGRELGDEMGGAALFLGARRLCAGLCRRHPGGPHDCLDRIHRGLGDGAAGGLGLMSPSP
jgi:hypothetical protein